MCAVLGLNWTHSLNSGYSGGHRMAYSQIDMRSPIALRASVAKMSILSWPQLILLFMAFFTAISLIVHVRVKRGCVRTAAVMHSNDSPWLETPSCSLLAVINRMAAAVRLFEVWLIVRSPTKIQMEGSFWFWAIEWNVGKTHAQKSGDTIWYEATHMR